MSLYPGDTTTQTITYKVDDVLTDPDTVKISIKDPLGLTIVTLVSATKDSTGVYHYDYTFADDAITGDYTFIWSITVGDVVSTHSQLIELELEPVSTHYADASTIIIDLNAHDAALKKDNYALVDSAIATAETIINGKLGLDESIQQADVPAAQWNVLVKAANLQAKACIMDDLYSKGDKRNQSAISYEKQSDIVLSPHVPG